MDAETKLTIKLEKWYDRVLSEVLELDLQYYLDNGLPLLKQDLQQIILDNYEDYKLIIGKQAVETFIDTDEKVDKLCELKEKEVITDTLLNYDDMKELPPVVEDAVLPLSPVVKANPFGNIIGGAWNFIRNIFNKDTGDVLTSFAERVTSGVRNSLETPSLLLDIVPDETVLEYLEERVFVASERTMQRVNDKIYSIIKEESEIEGKHPYEISKTLQKEYEGFKEYETKRIARTEVLRAKNESNWQRLNLNETVEYVQWFIGKLDSNSRREHVAQDGLITRLGESFPNGQRYPYDPRSAPGDYINCRCDLRAYYPEFGSEPPSGATWWTESEMVQSKIDFTSEVEFSFV